MGWPVVALGEVAKQVRRTEAPQPGTSLTEQIGVRLWGQGAYQRETVDGSETKYPVFYRVEKDDISCQQNMGAERQRSRCDR